MLYWFQTKSMKLQKVLILSLSCVLSTTNKFCYCRNRQRAHWRKHSIPKLNHKSHLSKHWLCLWSYYIRLVHTLHQYNQKTSFFNVSSFFEDRPTDQPTDRQGHVYRRTPSSKKSLSGFFLSLCWCWCLDSWHKALLSLLWYYWKSSI